MFTAFVIYKFCCVSAGLLHVGPFHTLKECTVWAREYDATGQNWNFHSQTQCKKS